MRDSFENALAAVPAIAIVRAKAADGVGSVIDVLARVGLRCIEVATTTPGALTEIAAAANRHDRHWLGAGTIVDAAGAGAAIEHGASFLVTPGVVPEVAAVAEEAGVPVVMGALTPTEILAARRAGASAVKLFPASLGGVDYLRALREPLPDVALVPTGGIGVDTAGSWLAAGARAVAVGSSLTGDAAAGGSLDALADRTRQLIAALEVAR